MAQENSGGNEPNRFGRYITKKRIAFALIAVIGLSMVGLILSFSGPKSAQSSKTKTVAQTNQHTRIEDKNGTVDPKQIKTEPSESDTDNQSEVQRHTPENKQNKDYSLFAEGIEPPGVAFVQSIITPLDYELNERFWGWRPNDILDFTDNINNFQLGVLETTRRSVERLVENISRTGSTAAFDKNLENARSTCFMVEAGRYWFPSPENKYNDGIEDLRRYIEMLKRNEAAFYTRADNLIPLLIEFEHLLGSCDDNLVKMQEKDGSEVSFFKADDYFYYAKGVASAMATILEAVEKDFHVTLDRRNCLPDLHHAIVSCHHASRIEPIAVMNSNLDSFFANHRANIASHISHARFYIGVLIKTLST